MNLSQSPERPESPYSKESDDVTRWNATPMIYHVKRTSPRRLREPSLLVSMDLFANKTPSRHSPAERTADNDFRPGTRSVHPHRHWQYVWLPLVGAFVWFGSLYSPIFAIHLIQHVFRKECFGPCSLSGWRLGNHDLFLKKDRSPISPTSGPVT